MENTQEQTCLLNGRTVQKSSLPSIDSLWIDVYEVVRLQEGVVLFAEDHFERFVRSHQTAGLPLSTGFDQWLNQMHIVATNNHLSSNNIRTDRFFSRDKLELELVCPIPSKYPTTEQRTNGVETLLQYDERHTPNAKITDQTIRGRANNMIASKAVFETLLVNSQHQITEGSRSNFFAIKGSQLFTAPEHLVLPGIMRKKVIEASNKLGVEIAFRPISISELGEIDAAFLTGTSPRVLPISTIDHTKLNVNHTVTTELFCTVEQMVADYITTHR